MDITKISTTAIKKMSDFFEIKQYTFDFAKRFAIKQYCSNANEILIGKDE